MDTTTQLRDSKDQRQSRLHRRNSLRSPLNLLIVTVIFHSILSFSLVYKAAIKENIALDCSISHFKYFPSLRSLNKTIASSSSTSNSNENSVLIIASSPLDEKHVVSLWSELECFVGSASRVVISSPYWADKIMGNIVEEARKHIPHFESGDVSIEVNFYDNERYDVGLWCDALQGRQEDFDNFVLLNDSLFALRKFNGIIEALQRKNASMTSLVYNIDEKNRTWAESMFRGFNKNGLSIFTNHSCVPQTHDSFCRTLTRKPKKRKTVPKLKKKCITKYHEVAMAWAFPEPDKDVLGLFPGTVPNKMRSENTSTFPTWVLHDHYWKEVMLEKYDFPAAKVNMEGMIGNLQDPLLNECTRHLDRSILDRLDFSNGIRALSY